MIVLALLLTLASGAAAMPLAPEATEPLSPEATVGMVRVEGGTYQPLYETVSGQKDVEVAAFYLAAQPVTNRQFLAFVWSNPQWRRSEIPALYSEEGYLRDWAGDLDIGDLDPRAPVVDVSWFASRAFARWMGRRLPTTHEWEYAAGASGTRTDGREDPEFTRQLLAWTSNPRPKVMPRVAQGTPNAWGVHDLHGLVWEWTGDFTSALVTTDSRANRDSDRALFCSAGAVGAADFTDYAAFLRYGYRSGLEARYVVPNLGFRTARDAPAPEGQPAGASGAIPDPASGGVSS